MKEIFAEIITIGDEILYGQIVDTNSQWMSAKLDEIGVKIVRKTTIGDSKQELLNAFSEAENRAAIVLITGGLGPTNDDITKYCLAEYFDSTISMNQTALIELEALFEKHGFTMTDTNRRQAELPDKCTMISNKNGTAPAMWFERNNKVFVSMPGVPHEMKAIMQSSVLPKLQRFFATHSIVHRMIKTAGIGESWLSDIIKDWEENLPTHIKLAYLPSLMQVKLRLTAIGDDKLFLNNEIETQISRLIPLIEKHIYGYDKDTLETVIGKILVAKGLTISTAESCTGGHVAHILTTVPGSSKYFQGGIIPYHNYQKINLLDVDSKTIEQHGAVSEETVIEMANGVRKKFGTDIGIASSGIMGPDGGTEEKPVGTIWIAYADGQKTVAKKLTYGNQRLVNIKRSTVGILYLIWKNLVHINEEDV